MSNSMATWRSLLASPTARAPAPDQDNKALFLRGDKKGFMPREIQQAIETGNIAGLERMIREAPLASISGESILGRPKVVVCVGQCILFCG